MARLTCSTCKGERLCPESLAFKINGHSIADLTFRSIRENAKFLAEIDLSESQANLASDILPEITQRINFLRNVGLEYLSLSRPAGTLSGGEIQRVHLATQIGSALNGILYVLDEPSIGLHQKDNHKLLDALQALTEKGNSVIVVEHDRDTIEMAEYIIDMGPGAGILGGHIVAEGTPTEIKADKNSITGSYLSHKNSVSIPKERRPFNKDKILRLEGCSKNNLKNVDVTFPLGNFICVTGVSGSGKSSLLLKSLIPSLKRILFKREGVINEVKNISGTDNIDKV